MPSYQTECREKVVWDKSHTSNQQGCKGLTFSNSSRHTLHVGFNKNLVGIHSSSSSIFHPLFILVLGCCCCGWRCLSLFSLLPLWWLQVTSFIKVLLADCHSQGPLSKKPMWLKKLQMLTVVSYQIESSELPSLLSLLKNILNRNKNLPAFKNT